MHTVQVGSLRFEAALFLGAALSARDVMLKMSSGFRIALTPLRTRDRINLARRGLKDSDMAALLGALSLNSFLRELDLSGNPAPAREGIKAAMIYALPWTLLRSLGSIQAAKLLEACHETNYMLDA